MTKVAHFPKEFESKVACYMFSALITSKVGIETFFYGNTNSLCVHLKF